MRNDIKYKQNAIEILKYMYYTFESFTSTLNYKILNVMYFK